MERARARIKQRQISMHYSRLDGAQRYPREIIIIIIMPGQCLWCCDCCHRDL